MQAEKWIGVDVHKRQITVCIMEPGKKPRTGCYERTSEGIEDFLKEIDRGCVVGMESTTWSRDLYVRTVHIAKDVIVFNTVDLKEMMGRLKKTDREDAERIALILRRFEKSELSICNMRSDENAEIKGLLNFRDRWVRRKTEAKNEIRSMLEFWGEESNGKLFAKDGSGIELINRKEKVPEDIKKGLIVLICLIMNAEESIHALDKKIDAKLSVNPAYRELKSKITGIGQTSAAYIVSKIEDINRFDNPKKLVSYLGLAPRVNQSDGKGFNGHISKRTDKAILKVLVQAAWVSVRYDPKMKIAYESLRIRIGKQKAIVAIARKLVVYCFYVWKNMEI